MNTFCQEKLKSFLFLLIILLLRPAFDKKRLPDGYRDLGDVAHPEVSGGRARSKKVT